MSLASLKKRWNAFAATASWLLMIVGAFVLRPAWWDRGEDATWAPYAHYLVTLLTALIFVPVSFFKERRHTWWWWGATIIMAIGAFVVFDRYQHRRATWTSNYAGERVVIGTTYTPAAQNYRATKLRENGRTPSDEELIMDFVGILDDIWLPAGRIAHRTILARYYLGSVCLFTLALTAAIQAAYCTTRRKKRAPRTTAAGGAAARTATTSSGPAADSTPDARGDGAETGTARRRRRRVRHTT